MGGVGGVGGVGRSGRPERGEWASAAERRQNPQATSNIGKQVGPNIGRANTYFLQRKRSREEVKQVRELLPGEAR